MKYLYKQTGVVVESSVELDSAIFTPLKENNETAEVKAEETPKKEAPKAAARKTTAAKTSSTQRKTTAKRTTSAKK